MIYLNRDNTGRMKKREFKHLFMSCCCLSTMILFLYACNSQPAPTAVKPAPVKSVQPAAKPAVAEQEAPEEESPEQEGYVYQRRDRRDPFIPLIVPKRKVQESEGAKVGTLESYDIHEFVLAAIAKKGGMYYALITTPDNRSFTVNKGTVLGLNKGKVKTITKNKLVLIEYIKNFRGQTQPRELILEFHKGEVE